MTLTGGNRHDVAQLLPLVDAFPIVRGVRGRPRLHPGYLYADRGYDYDVYRRALRERGQSRASPVAVSLTAPVWAAPAGSSSAPSPGCTSSSDCGSATRSEPICSLGLLQLACADLLLETIEVIVKRVVRGAHQS